MILVVGGAGYIGSHAVKQLLDQGYKVVVLDNLSTGHREAVDPRATFVQGDLGIEEDVARVLASYSIRGVMHFAAFSLVGESMVDPWKYYANNVGATLVLLKTMMKYGVKNFIFSSTAAVYGMPGVELIDESQPTHPINPYGKSKLMVEEILGDFSQAYGLKYVVLRYFNAAGAHQSGEIGEDHSPETHLIPIVLKHLLGEREKVSIFGADYETEDGTCIRDYIHIIDLARAHILALEALLREQFDHEVFNLGNGKGFSVQEIIELCEKVTGLSATVEVADRRPGDPAKLVASSDKIAGKLGWKAEYPLEEIIGTAWNWHKNHPKGF